MASQRVVSTAARREDIMSRFLPCPPCRGKGPKAQHGGGSNPARTVTHTPPHVGVCHRRSPRTALNDHWLARAARCIDHTHEPAHHSTIRKSEHHLHSCTAGPVSGSGAANWHEVIVNDDNAAAATTDGALVRRALAQVRARYVRVDRCPTPTRATPEFGVRVRQGGPKLHAPMKWVPLGSGPCALVRRGRYSK